MQLTQRQRNEIRTIFNRFNPDNTALFNNINQNKLDNARASFGQNIKADEEIIYLRDDTLFGSAKDGYIVTTKAIHGKPFLEQPLFINYEDIQDITYDKTKIVVQCKGNATYQFPLSTRCKKSTPLLNEMIAYLKKEGLTGQMVETSREAVVNGQVVRVENRCLGCGAPPQPQGKFCEYCGTRF